MSVLNVVFIVVVLLVACFGFVLFFGAPFLPTLKPQIDTALDMLDLKAGQTMLELGCGDGRVLIAAAKRGINSVGYELNPVLVVIAKIRTWPYRKRVKIVWGDFWRVPWPPADGIFGFILDKYMPKLHKKVMQYSAKPVKVASFAFPINEKKPAKTKNGIFLYKYT